MNSPGNSIALAMAMALGLMVSACETVAPDEQRPQFAQRAAPRAGQAEIELLAGLDARLARRGPCLGIVPRGDPDGEFTTIVWPANARLDQDEQGWFVRNAANGTVLRIGSRIRGGGGHIGELSGEALRRFNHYLT
ncbi:MAG: hypothetical protein IE921_16545, partial [Rhodobacteraceae bacterium]|nr:hypothetical protein [Paracoccaceae bacterium]